MSKKTLLLLVLSLFFGKGFGFFCAPCECCWTGFYVGGNLGGSDRTLYLFDIDYDWNQGTIELNKCKFIGGGQIGYNYEFCETFCGLKAVWGLESSFDWVGDSLKYVYSDTVTISSELQYFGTLHVRAGLSAAGFYLYFLGGAAYEKIKASWIESDDPQDSWPHLGKSVWGCTFGGGVEKCLTSKISLRAQVMSLRFPKSWTRTNDDEFPYVMNTDTLVGLVGINYRFSCFGRSCS